MQLDKSLLQQQFLGGAAFAPHLREQPSGGAAPAAPPPGDIELDYVGSVANAATVIAAPHRGEKRLVFCESRRTVEELGEKLRLKGVTTFLSHASLSVDERRRAETAFAEARDCVIVSTSTLELGIDVGDLDHLVAQQLLALCLQEHRVGENLWQEWWGGIGPFGPGAAPVVRHLVERGYLDQEVDSRAVRGLKFGEALPPRLAEATLAARTADEEGAGKVLAEPARFVTLPFE